ncbi:MAG: PQQ-binding-like beta-propeller repeat protein [Pirellulales bacterium]
MSDKVGKPKGMSAGAMDLSTMGLASPPKSDVTWKINLPGCRERCSAMAVGLAVGKPEQGKHASNTYATETPAANEQAVISFIAPLGLVVAVDHYGKELWRRDVGKQKIQNQFGTGSSPLLVGDSLIVQQYNEDFARILCLNANDGSERWKAERSKGTSWATPIAWKNGDVTEILGAGNGSVIAYDLKDGSERWRVGGIDTSFSGSLTADADGVYIGTASPGSRAPIMAVRPGQSGDLTLPKGKASSEGVMWSKSKSGAGMPSPVVIGNRLFFLGDQIVCWDKLSGREIFRKRLPGGTLAAGCPVVVDGRLIAVNEKGKLMIIPISDQFEVAHELQVGTADEITWATPAVTADSILVRSSEAIYCIR